MRVLILPLIGAISNLASESNFTSFRAVWRTGRQRWPEFFAHVAMPHTQIEAATKVLTDDERSYVELIPEPEVPAPFHIQEGLFDPGLVRRFNRYTGTQWIDEILTSRLLIGNALMASMGDWRGMAGAPGIGLYEPGISQDRLGDKPENRAAHLAKALSVAVCPTQFLTQEELDKLMFWARRVASPTSVHDIMTHSKIIQPTIGGVSADPVAAPKDHVLFFGGRMSVGKNIPFIFDLYSKVFALGYTVKIIVTCPSTIKPYYGNIAKEKGKGPDGEYLIRLVSKCGRDEFHRLSRTATIGLIASTHEGYPSGFLEMAVSGQLTLFPNDRWARDSLPPDYPWIYRNEAEALAFLKRGLTWEWVPMVKQQLASLRPYHKTQESVYHDQRWDWWVDPRWETEYPRPRRAPKDISQFMEEFAVGRESFTLAEACQGVVERSRAMSARTWNNPPARFWCRPGVAAELRRLGWMDACDGPETRYVRDTEVDDGEREVGSSGG